jgi:Na+/proline symporter
LRFIDVCYLSLPRQFHTAIVENNSEKHIRTALWLFPLYLLLLIFSSSQLLGAATSFEGKG